MVPNPFMMALLGHSLSEIEHADREEYVQSLERHIEAQSSAYDEGYRKLSSGYSRLLDYAKTLETERDRLRSQIKEISRYYPAIEDGLNGFVQEFQRVRAESEMLAKEVDVKLKAYKAVKALLTRLVDQSEVVFSPKVTKEQIENLRTFIQALP